MTRRSIKIKILISLLSVSILPLLIFVGIIYFDIERNLDQVRNELKDAAQENIVRIAEDQAELADAILNKVEAEAEMLAYTAELIINSTPNDSAEPPAAPSGSGSTMVVMAPDVNAEKGLQEAKNLLRMGRLFGLIDNVDPNIEVMYLGTQTGLHLTYPGNEAMDARMFSLEKDVFLSEMMEDSSSISEAVRERFKQHGTVLSAAADRKVVEPGKKWVVRDLEAKRVFSIRNQESLDVYWEYDPRIRPWYIGASSMPRATWSKYPNWARNRGALLFNLDQSLIQHIQDKVTPALKAAFAEKQVALVEGDPIVPGQRGYWRIQDKNGKNFEIRKEGDFVNVYGIDVLTCSRAVRSADGRLFGVVGLDISMNSVSKRIINTPEKLGGAAFLLNEKGELIEQERVEMYLPAVGSEIRKKMMSGQVGLVHDAAHRAYVAYAPIPSFASRDGQSSWSIGISMSEAAVTRIVSEFEQRISLMFTVLFGLLAIMIILMALASIRVARGITNPILQLSDGASRLGKGELQHRMNVCTGDEIEELAVTFNKMATDLEAYIRNLQETTAAKERFESELRVAHEIQMSFLKKIFPPFPNRKEFSIYVALEPAREVGGDLYDFMLLDEDRLLFYVGDVSDKGVPASLVMAMTMTLMKRAAFQRNLSPAGILRQVNEALAEDNQSAMFVTLFLGILNLRSGELQFSNAGHNPPLILKADGRCSYLKLPDGLVLGVMTEAVYADDTIMLEPGDTIIAYTDGVTEAMGPDHLLYSEEYLLETVTALKGQSTDRMVAEIIRSVHDHAADEPQSDDITVLALQRSVLK